MKEYYLDFDPSRSWKEIHQMLRENLELSPFYGENLDALYDELTSITKDTAIHIKCHDALTEEYEIRVLQVLQDAEEINPHVMLCAFDTDLPFHRK